MAKVRTDTFNRIADHCPGTQANTLLVWTPKQIHRDQPLRLPRFQEDEMCISQLLITDTTFLSRDIRKKRFSDHNSKNPAFWLCFWVCGKTGQHDLGGGGQGKAVHLMVAWKQRNKKGTGQDKAPKDTSFVT